MATTAYPVNHPMAVKHWSGDVFKEALKRTYASRFMGTGSNSLCQVRNEMKSEGDRVRIPLRLQLAGEGVLGDGTLEGNEEALAIYHDDVYIDQLRHAVRSAGKMSEQRVPFEVRMEARDGLADWWADKYDFAFFNQLSGNTDETRLGFTGLQSPVAPTTNNIVLEATSTASISATHLFGVDLIDYATEVARTDAPYPLRPLMMNGKEYYVTFCHEYQATDMRRSYSAGEWGDIQKSVIESGAGEKNPVFTGALGIYGGSVIHATTRLPVNLTTKAGANTGARAVLAGSQALAIAWGKGYTAGNKYSWVEELFDYENQLGVAAGCIFGVKKLQFNSADFATITIPTYAVSHA